MACVPVPKDLTKVKSKLLFNLTKRQLICFGGGALIGVPLFFLLRGILGASSAAILMVLSMLPLFVMGLYEKNGRPLEKVLGDVIQTLFLRPKQRALGASAMYGYQFYNMQMCARDHGWARFEAMENHYNLLYREDEQELIPICRQMGVSLMPYSPLAAGHLTRPTWNADTLRSQTDRVAMGKYDRTEEQDMQIVARVHELAEKYGVKMQQIALAWEWARGVASPIVGATKTQYLDDAAGALAVRLTAEDVAYLEEPYLPHRIVGAIDRNPADGVVLLDEKK